PHRNPLSKSPLTSKRYPIGLIQEPAASMTDNHRVTISQRLFVVLQYSLPQHLLSKLMFRLTRLRLGPITRLLVRGFIRAFRVDMDDAMQPDLAAYPNFNTFFTRALRPEARPLEPNTDAIVSPVDGCISQLGKIQSGRIVQAKNRDFACEELLGGDSNLAACFDDGLFATLYLSPKDYHRVHMPLDGSLVSILYIPGRLFSVNQTTAAMVPRLFARNERVVCLFETKLGPMALVLIGAIFVGSIETIWTGQITPRPGRSIAQIPPTQGKPELHRGTEFGRFNMGSTVILLLPQGNARWLSRLGPSCLVRYGEALGFSLAST
ncbi:MAG: hypothetical protein N838_09680, partial [Thiohalocapsa sp. PB-PSB1]